MGAAPGQRLGRRGTQSGPQGPDGGDRVGDLQSQAGHNQAEGTLFPQAFPTETGPEAEGTPSGCRAEGLWLVQGTRPEVCGETRGDGDEGGNGEAGSEL